MKSGCGGSRSALNAPRRALLDIPERRNDCMHGKPASKACHSVSETKIKGLRETERDFHRETGRKGRMELQCGTGGNHEQVEHQWLSVSLAPW